MSEGGGLLFRESERSVGGVVLFVGCFTDCRNPARIEHTGQEPIGCQSSDDGVPPHDLQFQHNPLLRGRGRRCTSLWSWGWMWRWRSTRGMSECAL